MPPTKLLLALTAMLAGMVSGAARAQALDDPRLSRGRALFDRAFHLAQGLGNPGFNADSCRACHSRPILGGAGPLELNVFRFAADNGGAGPFLDLPGGQAASKLQSPLLRGRESTANNADVFEQRQTPSILGDGLIDGIADAVITANEDPIDADGDSIYGVARRLTIQGTVAIGRFGWKAQVPRLSDFVRDAMTGELGITVSADGRGFGSDADNDGIADPELTDNDAEDLALFLASLPAPTRRGSQDPMVAQGNQIFHQIGCAKCHIPELAGSSGPVALYSNLLLHNVMPSNFRGMSELGAAVGLYRTPPLWGIRDTAPYMHDGRAETLLGAIRAHDGEAQQVRQRFEQLPSAEKSALQMFLEDL